MPSHSSRSPINSFLLSAVKLNIALYRPQSLQGGPGTGRVPVALGIKGYQLYMSCVLSGAEPMLQLEVSRGVPLAPTRLGLGAPPHPESHFTPLVVGS